MIVSLSHEIRIEGQDAAHQKSIAPASHPDDVRAKERAEQQRLLDEHGLDTPQEEIDEKEESRIKQEQEKEEENTRTIPEGLGLRKSDPEKEQYGNDIQNQHDLLNKI